MFVEALLSQDLSVTFLFWWSELLNPKWEDNVELAANSVASSVASHCC